MDRGASVRTRRSCEARPGGRPLLLVLRALGLGDLLTAVPALRGLARAYPEHRRVLAAPRALEPLARLTGAVDAVADAAPLAPLDVALAGADVAINLHGRGPQSHAVLLDTRPRRLVAFAHPALPESAGGPPWRSGEHEAARWCRLLEECGIATDPGDLDLPRPPEPTPVEARGATLVHPGAGSASRRWPVDRFAAVARSEARAGRRVLISGGPNEAKLARAVADRAGLPPSAVLAGGTGVGELAALVAAAARVVCGDTGMAHLATALRTPSVVLFGPTSPAEWGPPPDRPWHRALWAGRTGDPHGATPDPGLLQIQVTDVLAALAGLPDRREVAVAGPEAARAARRGEDAAAARRS